MGCVNSKDKTKHKKQNHDQTKDNPKNTTPAKKQHFKSATYTSIEEVLQRDENPKKSDRYLKSSQQAQILGKYRMSAQQNKCAVPKITACEYGTLLIHNPADFDTPQHEAQSSPSRKKNQQALLSH